MNPRIVKDIRLIGFPVGLGIAAMAFVSGTNQFWCLLAWVIACAILVAAGFAGELVPNGFAFSMSMPGPRRQLWKEKMFVLGGGLLVLTLALLLADLRLDPVQNVRSTAAWFLLTFPLFAFGVGAVLSLWTRQPLATIWLLLMVLGLVFVLTEWLVPLVMPTVYPGSIFEWVVIGLAIFGGYLGRRQFLNFEDDQSETAFQGLDFSRLFARRVDGTRSAPTSTVLPVLLRKELALQQINFLIAIASVVVITVSGVAVLKSGNKWMGYVSMLTKMIALFVAFSVGAVAFSEEHVIGTSLLNMTLPATRRMQFLVKSMVTLICGVVLAGGGMLVIDGLVASLASSRAFTPVFALRSSYLILLCLIAPFMGTLAGAFASSFSRTFLTSLSGTFVLGMSLWGSYVLIFVMGRWWNVSPIYYSRNGDPNNALLFLTGVPVLVVIFAWRIWQNFSIDMLAGTARFKSARAVVIGVMLILTVNLFFNGRLWELAEPAPTDARFGKAPVKTFPLPRPVLTEWGRMAIALDGSLWQVGRGIIVSPTQWSMKTPAQVGRDLDWRELGETPHGFYALKQDGSLWGYGNLAHPKTELLPAAEAQRLRTDPAYIGGVLTKPVPVFPGTHWKHLVRGSVRTESVAIRDDGSLWLWGVPGYEEGYHNRLTSAEEFKNPDAALIQIGQDKDWIEVTRGRGVYFCLKEDGSVWVWGDGNRSVFGLGRVNPSLIPERLALDATIKEIVPMRAWSSIVLRPTTGPAMVFGEWVFGMWAPRLPADLEVTPIKLSIHALASETEKLRASEYYENRKLYLTGDDVVLDVNPLKDISDWQGDWRELPGANWSAIGQEEGFTRDGSFWSYPGRYYQGEAGAGDRMAQWLGLTYGGEQTDLIPRRWRMKRFELR